MTWQTYGERTVYDSPWVKVDLVDVDIPGHGRVDHHALRFPRPAVGVIVHDPYRGLLMIHRHRFLTGTRGWEVPAGGVDEGETPEQAAARETLEETGWRPGPLRHLLSYHPSNGISDQEFQIWQTDSAELVGDPDPAEADRVDWLPVARLREMVTGGLITDGMSLTAVMRFLVTRGR
ncbi:NUDIX hydrolase [Cellulomonas sp. NPDC089187]|uniref:NUDIX hydrolase n=1 Tax=Cellulomonas sp. NPDC089187 TaxID=3154970 RepID=UPI00342D285C